MYYTKAAGESGGLGKYGGVAYILYDPDEGTIGQPQEQNPSLHTPTQVSVNAGKRTFKMKFTHISHLCE